MNFTIFTNIDSIGPSYCHTFLCCLFVRCGLSSSRSLTWLASPGVIVLPPASLPSSLAVRRFWHRAGVPGSGPVFESSRQMVFKTKAV